MRPGPSTADLPEASDSTAVSRDHVLVSARWRGLLQVAQQLLSVLATMLLARLLTPDDFGVVAAALSALTFLSLASAWGFGAAVVRRSSVDDRFLGGILSANVALGFATCGIGVALSPVIAHAIGAPDATWAIAAVMPVMIVIAFQGTSVALLERRMQFGRMSVVGIAATVLYVAVEIVLALLGFGYWAVIWGYLAMQVAQGVGYVLAAGWRPRFASPVHVVRQEGRFSLGYFGNEVLQYANKNIDYWVVGVLLGTAALGSYYIAFVLPTILRMRFTAVVQQLLFPVFSRLSTDPGRTRRVYASAIELQAVVGVPAMVGLAVVAEPLVQVFFGEQWAATVQPMRWIALAAVLDLVGTAMGQVAMAHGMMLRYFWVNAGRLVVFGATIAAAAWLTGSLTGVAVAVFLTSLAALVLGQLLVGAPLGLHLGLVARRLAHVCALSAVMAALVWLTLDVVQGLTASPIVQLVAGVSVGACSYVGLGLLTDRVAFRQHFADLGRILGLRHTRKVIR